MGDGQKWFQLSKEGFTVEAHCIWMWIQGFTHVGNFKQMVSRCYSIGWVGQRKACKS